MNGNIIIKTKVVREKYNDKMFAGFVLWNRGLSDERS